MGYVDVTANISYGNPPIVGNPKKLLKKTSLQVLKNLKEKATYVVLREQSGDVKPYKFYA